MFDQIIKHVRDVRVFKSLSANSRKTYCTVRKIFHSLRLRKWLYGQPQKKKGYTFMCNQQNTGKLYNTKASQYVFHKWDINVLTVAIHQNTNNRHDEV